MSKNFKKTFLFHLSVVLVLCAILYTSFFATLHWVTKHGEELKIPDVRGKDLNTALTQLKGMHFEVYVDSIYEPAAKPLSVLKQVPDTGSAVKEGRTVFLTVNMLTPPHIPMPNLVNLSFRSAEMLLRNNKLLLGDTTFVPDIAAGAVKQQLYKGQEIRSGEMISQGSKISLVIGNGLGNTEFDMPEVTGRTVDEAQAILAQYNLQAIIVPADQMSQITDTPSAVIVDQRPRAVNDAGVANRVKAGEIIDLTIEQNPAPNDVHSNTNVPADVNNGDNKKETRKLRKIIVIIYLMLAALNIACAQENVGPIRYNPLQQSRANKNGLAKKTSTTPLSLPFFEDFTQYSPYTDSNKWVEQEVYINNTMGASPIGWGVATFDDLDANGIPYDSFSNTNFMYADSLTSQPIDLSSNGPGDSLYLSFFYQPQGNGFYPLPQDSLMLYMKTIYGGFVKVWSVPGSSLLPFQMVMLPIVDSIYFSNSFQFRFVNIAALYWADAVWNVDYIKLDKNRSASDTLVQDVAFTSSPTYLLNDYTSMPWSQYAANPISETVSQVNDSLRNGGLFGPSINYFFSVRDDNSGSSLFTAGGVPFTFGSYGTTQTPENFSTPTLPTYPNETKVTFESQYYIQSTPSTGPVSNDTIIKKQVFDNYLAYDDGTAEKSYYLNLFPTLPGIIAVEYHLNHPDTMRGMAIYFGKTVPLANNKVFSINVYYSLAGVNGAGRDSLIFTTDFVLNPGYVDTVNHFWVYRFDSGVVLPAGTFYAGTEQCAECGSDSLYIGLDVNRVGGNHAYYNVLGTWSPSLISGALMMRPMLGAPIAATSVATVQPRKGNWQVMPNPAVNNLQFEFGGTDPATYHITDIMGHTLMSGKITNGQTIDISGLTPGMYFADLVSGSIYRSPQKFIKL